MSPPRIGGEADRGRVALAGYAFARIHCDIVELRPSAPAITSPILQRGAGRRIDLVAVMCLDDFDVVAFGKIACAAISSNFIVTLTPTLMLGANTMAVRLGGGGDRGLAGVVETGGADDHLDAMLGAVFADAAACLPGG